MGNVIDVNMAAKTGSWPRYILVTWGELARLIFCLSLDIAEYFIKILLVPVLGDVLDLIGIAACLIMFGWVSLISALELVPYMDVLPIFTLTWVTWYYLKGKRPPYDASVCQGP